MGLNIKDLIVDKVYQTSLDGKNKSWRVFRLKKGTYGEILYKSRVDLNNFNRNSIITTSKYLENIREATQDEIDWLKACEKEDKYVDKPVKKEFKKDDYYYIEDRFEYCWLIKFIECNQDNNIIAACISFNTNSFYSKGNWGNLNSIKSSRLATSEEKTWLDECIKLNKYIPKDKIKTGFKKDDYIVLLLDINSNFKLNYCYKQREDSSTIRPYLDSSNNKGNGVLNSNYENSSNWRCANKEEIEHYEKIGGKPYDVTTLIKSEYLKPEELVKEQWYKRYDQGDCNYLVKIKEVRASTIEYYCYHNYAGNFNHGLSLGSPPNKNYVYKPASSEEVLKYFPDEKFTMSFEEALIECKRRYPIGTKFHPVNHKYPNGNIYETFKIEGSNFLEFKNSVYKSKEVIVENKTSGILWYNGVFAEIVKPRSVLDDLEDCPQERDCTLGSVVDQLKAYQSDFNWKQREVEIKVWNYGKPENKSKKLEIFIDSPTLIKVEPIVELKIKKVSKLTV